MNQAPESDGRKESSLRESKILVVWPEYFDSKRTRSEGRRVPKRLAVDSPKAAAIVEAAEKLGLNSTVENEVAYPRSWWTKSGKVSVEKRWSKAETLRQIAKKMKLLSG